MVLDAVEQVAQGIEGAVRIGLEIAVGLADRVIDGVGDLLLLDRLAIAVLP